MNGPPTAYVVHAMPGRVRVRVPHRKGDAAFFDGMASRLAEIPAVTAVVTNPLTGSVLVHFTGDIEALAISAMALLELSPPPAQPIMQRVRGEVANVDMTIRRLTNGELDARSVMFCGLLAFSAVQLLRGNILAPAATMLWYTAELARQWQPAGLDASGGDTPQPTG